jgi:hypothetical protein
MTFPWNTAVLTTGTALRGENSDTPITDLCEGIAPEAPELSEGAEVTVSIDPKGANVFVVIPRRARHGSLRCT